MVLSNALTALTTLVYEGGTLKYIERCICTKTVMDIASGTVDEFCRKDAEGRLKEVARAVARAPM